MKRTFHCELVEKRKPEPFKYVERYETDRIRHVGFTKTEIILIIKQSVIPDAMPMGTHYIVTIQEEECEKNSPEN